MRYQIGQKLLAVHFLFADTPHPWMFRMPLMWGRGMPIQINLVLLTVEEHHKVPNEWDTEDKLECDGFILLGEEGEVWHNQYPRASYGQTTDTADRRFNLRLGGSAETFEKLFSDMEADPKNNFVETELLSSFLDNVKRALDSDKPVEGKPQLQVLYDTLLEGVKANFPGTIVEYVPHAKYPSLSKHVFTFKEEVAS